MYESGSFSPFTMCSSADSVATVSMTKPVRKGYLTRYKKRILGSNWREEWTVLHEDSTLEWYKDHDESDLVGAIMLKEAPEMIAAGPFACYVPNRPELPKNTDPNNMMVFGNKAKDRTHWFLCKNMDDLNQWMTAISNTLPPPPEQPKPPDQGDQTGGEPPPYTPAPSAPPQQPASNPAFVRGGGQGGPTYNPPAGGGGYRGGYGGQGGGGYRGGYGGGGGYGRGGYGGGGGTNTVVIDRGGNDGMGFASGMMMGAALSGWGPGYGVGFGGWGIGMGFGVPMYGGIGGFHGGGFHNQETNITNNYINNETTNNTETAGDPTNPDAGAVDPAIGGGAAPEAEPVDPGGGGGYPDAEMIPDGVDPGLLDEGGYDGGYEDMGGMDGGFDMGGMDDMGGGYDMGGMDDMGGGFDMGGFDMGGFDF